MYTVCMCNVHKIKFILKKIYMQKFNVFILSYCGWHWQWWLTLYSFIFISILHGNCTWLLYVWHPHLPMREREGGWGGSLLRENNLLSWTLWTLLMMVRYVCSFLSKWSLDSVVFVVILQCSVWSRLPEENSNLYPALARIWRGSMSRHRSSKEGLLFSLSR